MKRERSLREFVTDLREAKTAAKERSVVENEKAFIRQMISKQKTAPAMIARSIAKLIMIEMLDYNTDFGSFECLKLATSKNLPHKRIGYLGLSQLGVKNQELLILSTNTIQQDLRSSDNVIISIALAGLANFATSDMCRDLEPDITRLFSHKSAFIQKKAIITSASILRKCPDLIESVLTPINEIVIDNAVSVMVQLFLEILKTGPRYLDALEKYAGLLTSRFFKIKSDGNLQVNILRFLSYYPQFYSNEFESALYKIAISSNNKKRDKLSLYYQCAITLLKSRSTELKQLGNNMVNSFLSSREPNLRFAALRTLHQIADSSVNSIQLQAVTISDCLKDTNEEVCLSALDLSFKLLTSHNIIDILKIYLNFLMTNEKLQARIVRKIGMALCCFTLEPTWHLDTVIKVSILAKEVPDDMINNCIEVIRSNSSIQPYAVQKLLYALQAGHRQNALLIISL